jgi:hypothetical protein
LESTECRKNKEGGVAVRIENDFPVVWSIGFGVPIILVREVRRAAPFEPIADIEEYISWMFLNI